MRRRLTKYNRNGIPKVNAEQPVPVGTLVAFGGTTAPGGWLLCQGGEASKTDYPVLNTICGTTYGANTNGSGGAGSTHFRLPDLRGRIPVGAGTGAGNASSGTGATSGTALTARTLGATVGSETVTLTGAESGVPAHNHGVNQNNHTHSVSDSHTHSIGFNYIGNTGAPTAYAAPDGTYPNSYNMVSASIGWSHTSKTSGISITDYSATTAGSSHTNTQPFVVLTYIIRAL